MRFCLCLGHGGLLLNASAMFSPISPSFNCDWCYYLKSHTGIREVSKPPLHLRVLNPNFLLSPGREWPADRCLPGRWRASAQTVPHLCGSPHFPPEARGNCTRNLLFIFLRFETFQNARLSSSRESKHFIQVASLVLGGLGTGQRRVRRSTSLGY